VSTVSTLALMVLYAIFGSLAQFGTRPHRKASKVRCLVSGSSRIAKTSCVGAMFQLIGRSRCGGIGIHIGEQVLPAPWFVDNVHTYSTLNQIFRPIQRFPQILKSVRIIAFAFFLDGGVPEAAYRGCFVANPEGFRQGMFQGLALGIKRLLCRWRNRNFSGFGENQAKSL
jgi:hypothetical protein